jgi:thioredoxin-like negative regulator of GroEL
LTPPPDPARITALRRAVANDPDNREYRLALAAAVDASGDTSAAQRILRALREAAPDDSRINLALARLEARGRDVDASRRDYENVLSELWMPASAAQRRAVRLELIDFLLANGDSMRALPELLTLTTEIPDQAASHIELGQRMLRAGDARRARDQFVLALALDPDDDRALSGAGRAAFALGDYVAAGRYLSAVPDQTETRELLQVTREVLARDPLARRIGTRERVRRVSGLLQQAGVRIDDCAARITSAALLHLRALRADADALQTTIARGGEDARDLSEDGVDLAYRMEAAADEACGAAQAPADRAILLIGHRTEGAPG